MDTNDVNDILNDLGINNTPQPESSVSSSYFSDEDIEDIMENNGIQDAVFEGEGSEEERENDQSIENSSQVDEMEHQLYQQALEEVDPDVNEDSEEEEQNLETARETFQEALDEEAPATETNESLSETPSEEHVTPEDAKIQLNSPTLLIDESTTRFSGAEWFNEIQKQRIIVGGCGGIGSNLVFQLARMVPANITIYDDDNVELVNMAGQLYSYLDVGKAKVNAMANMILKYTATRQVNAIREKFTDTTEAGNIMMCGFDNMRARKTFFNSWYDYVSKKSMEKRAKCLLLDGRLSMNELQIFCIKGDDEYNINRYQSEFLFSDYEAEQTVCSMKQTTYLACMIGSLMVNLFTNFVANSLNPIIPYDLPFFTEYDAQNMLFKTEN